MHPYALLAIFGTSLAVWVFLLVMEARSGARMLGSFRTFLDDAVTGFVKWWHTHLPRLNRYYFRQLFHYFIHIALSALLWCVGRVEKTIKRIVRLNRSRARVAREPREPKGDSHLSQALAHKETVALSEEEKTARKEAALLGREEN